MKTEAAAIARTGVAQLTSMPTKMCYEGMLSEDLLM